MSGLGSFIREWGWGGEDVIFNYEGMYLVLLVSFCFVFSLLCLVFFYFVSLFFFVLYFCVSVCLSFFLSFFFFRSSYSSIQNSLFKSWSALNIMTAMMAILSMYHNVVICSVIAHSCWGSFHFSFAVRHISVDADTGYFLIGFL